MKISAVILAGGQGTRIGGGKPMLMLGGTTLLDRAIDYALTQSDLVAIAVRDAQQVGGVSVPTIHDDAAIEGPLAGLVSALGFAVHEGAGAVLTLPADMPFLPSDFATRLAKGLAGNRAAVAKSCGHLHPVCGLWRTEAVDSVPAYLASDRRSLRGFAEAVGYVAVDWPSDPEDPFFNINTPVDLASAEQRLQR